MLASGTAASRLVNRESADSTAVEVASQPLAVIAPSVMNDSIEPIFPNTARVTNCCHGRKAAIASGKRRLRTSTMMSNAAVQLSHFYRLLMVQHFHWLDNRGPGGLPFYSLINRGAIPATSFAEQKSRPNRFKIGHPSSATI